MRYDESLDVTSDMGDRSAVGLYRYAIGESCDHAAVRYRYGTKRLGIHAHQTQNGAFWVHMSSLSWPPIVIELSTHDYFIDINGSVINGRDTKTKWAVMMIPGTGT